MAAPTVSVSRIGSNWVFTATGATTQNLFTVDVSQGPSNPIVASTVFPQEVTSFLQQQLALYGAALGVDGITTALAGSLSVLGVGNAPAAVPGQSGAPPVITITLTFSQAGSTLLQFATTITNGINATPVLVQDGLVTLQSVVGLSSLGTVGGATSLDFAGGALTLTADMSGAVTLAASNIPNDKSLSLALRLTNGTGGPLNVGYDAAWGWVGTKPANPFAHASGAVGLLVLKNTGSSAAEIVASWEIIA